MSEKDFVTVPLVVSSGVIGDDGCGDRVELVLVIVESSSGFVDEAESAGGGSFLLGSTGTSEAKSTMQKQLNFSNIVLE